MHAAVACGNCLDGSVMETLTSGEKLPVYREQSFHFYPRRIQQLTTSSVVRICDAVEISH